MLHPLPGVPAIGVWYQRHTTQCFWDDSDVVIAQWFVWSKTEHIELYRFGPSRGVIPYVLSFWWLYCSEYENYRWLLKVEDEIDE